MATEVQQPQTEQSVASLLGGIVNDIQDLIKQQLRLTRQEIEADLRKSKQAASLLAAGWALCYVGLIGVCLMLAHLFHWLGEPAGTDPSRLPLWGGFALAAALFLISGGSLIILGRSRMESIGTPLNETAQALKENIEWKTRTSPS